MELKPRTSRGILVPSHLLLQALYDLRTPRIHYYGDSWPVYVFAGIGDSSGGVLIMRVGFRVWLCPSKSVALHTCGSITSYH